MSETIRAGIIGMGFMGRTHARAYAAAERSGLPVRLTAVADPDRDRRRGLAAAGGNFGEGDATSLLDPTRVTGYEAAESLLADPEIDVVSICTYTDSHADLAVRAMEAGKHVIVEKPVGLTIQAVRRVAEAAASRNRICMPAMCMRFWPAWRWLRDQIVSGALGPVRTAVFQRLGSAPAWAPDFYGNASRSGGALFDLHIHDADFVRWCFGRPTSVASVGSEVHLASVYRFDDGPDLVLAEGGWAQTPSFGFRMRFVVNFRGATADFDLQRSDPLLVHTSEGSAVPDYEVGDGYDHEIAHAINAIRGNEALDATVHDALEVTRLLLAERESITTGRPVSLD